MKPVDQSQSPVRPTSHPIFFIITHHNFRSSMSRPGLYHLHRRLIHLRLIAYIQWHALGREEQSKYYELARKERQVHMQLHPGWTARDNYAQGKKRKRRREKPSEVGGKPIKKKKKQVKPTKPQPNHLINERLDFFCCNFLYIFLPPHTTITTPSRPTIIYYLVFYIIFISPAWFFL